MLKIPINPKNPLKVRKANKVCDAVGRKGYTLKDIKREFNLEGEELRALANMADPPRFPVEHSLVKLLGKVIPWANKCAREEEDRIKYTNKGKKRILDMLD